MIKNKFGSLCENMYLRGTKHQSKTNTYHSQWWSKAIHSCSSLSLLNEKKFKKSLFFCFFSLQIYWSLYSIFMHVSFFPSYHFKYRMFGSGNIFSTRSLDCSMIIIRSYTIGIRESLEVDLLHI